MKIEVKINGKQAFEYPCARFLGFDDAIDVAKKTIEEMRLKFPNNQITGRVVASRKVSSWV